MNEEPVSLGKWARMDTRTRKLRAAGPALITARAAVLLLIVASNTALNDVRNNAVLSLARIVEQPRDAFEDLASRHISQHMEQSTRMVSRSGTWRALGSLCSDLGDQLVGLVRPGEDCKELQRHSIPAVEVAWGPGHHLGLQSLDPSLGSPDTDNGAVRPPMAQPCPVEDETDQEDGKEGGGEVSVAGKVSFDKERELEETAAAWARRFGTRLGSWLGSARQMLQVSCCLASPPAPRLSSSIDVSRAPSPLLDRPLRCT